jgi:O-antigen ligase
VLNGLPLTQRGLVLASVFAGLLMTQSRGPWLGVALALLFAVLVRVFSVGRAAVAFAVLLAVLGVVAFYVGDRYTTGTRDQAATEEQSTAIYRRQLLESYTPVVKERMAFGWGVSDYPAANGQRSIDNQYLWLAVTRGFVGMGMFLIIGAGSGIRLVQLAGCPLCPEDRMLVYAHMAVLLGLMTTFTTVFMGEQVVPLFFLVIGWMQAVNPVRVNAGVAPAFGPPFKFRRVLS